MIIGKMCAVRCLGFGLLACLALVNASAAHIKMASAYGFGTCNTVGDVTICNGTNIFDQDPAFLFSFAGAPPTSFTVDFGTDTADSYGVVTGVCSTFNMGAITCLQTEGNHDVTDVTNAGGALGNGDQKFTLTGFSPSETGLANIIFEYTSQPTDAPTIAGDSSGTPEPGSFVLTAIGIGMGLLGLTRRRRDRLH